MRARAVSASMRSLASRVQRRFPQLFSHQHIRDAAGALDAGQPEGAKRHLNAAIDSFAPMQLRRSGIADDAGHADAKVFMHETNRHLLLTKDVQDGQPPAGRTAEAPRQFAGQAGAIELAGLAKEMGLRLRRTPRRIFRSWSSPGPSRARAADQRTPPRSGTLVPLGPMT